MTKYLAFALLFITAKTYGSEACLCYSDVEDYPVIEEFTDNKFDCYRKVKAISLETYSQYQFCAKEAPKLKWGCFADDLAPKKTKNFKVNCDQIQNEIINQSYTKSLSKNGIKISQEDLLAVFDQVKSLGQIPPPPQVDSEHLLIMLEDYNEAHKIFRLFYPGEAFDKFDKNAISLQLGNDDALFGLFNFLKDDEQRKAGGDIGHTHFQYLTIKKSVGKQYILSLELSSHLYTAFPRRTQISVDEFNQMTPDTQQLMLAGNEVETDNDGGVKVNQVFVEENFQKLILSRLDQGRGLRYTVAAGRHYINGKDLNTIWLLSGLKAQHHWHNVLIAIDPRLARDYKNQSQLHRNEVAAFIEAEIEKQNIFRLSRSHAVKTGLGAKMMGTGIEDASYVQASAEAAYFYQYSPKNLAYKIGTRFQSRYYTSGEHQNQSIVEFGVAGKKMMVNFQIINHFEDDPLHLQAHPGAHELDREKFPRHLYYNNTHEETLYNVELQTTL